MLIVVGVCIGFGYLMYVGLVEPHYRTYFALQKQVPQKRLTHEWMKDQVEQIQPLLQASKLTSSEQTSSGSLVSTLENSLKQTGLSDKVKRIRAQSRDEVRIWFADVDFNQWISWLDQLKRSDIETAATKVERSLNRLVNIQVTLKTTIVEKNDGV